MEPYSPIIHPNFPCPCRLPVRSVPEIASQIEYLANAGERINYLANRILPELGYHQAREFLLPGLALVLTGVGMLAMTPFLIIAAAPSIGLGSFMAVTRFPWDRTIYSRCIFLVKECLQRNPDANDMNISTYVKYHWTLFEPYKCNSHSGRWW